MLMAIFPQMAQNRNICTIHGSSPLRLKLFQNLKANKKKVIADSMETERQDEKF